MVLIDDAIQLVGKQIWQGKIRYAIMSVDDEQNVHLVGEVGAKDATFDEMVSKLDPAEAR